MLMHEILCLVKVRKKYIKRKYYIHLNIANIVIYNVLYIF